MKNTSDKKLGKSQSGTLLKDIDKSVKDKVGDFIKTYQSKNRASTSNLQSEN